MARDLFYETIWIDNKTLLPEITWWEDIRKHIVLRRIMRKCMLDCDGKHYAAGFCEKHYRRWHRGAGHWKTYLDLEKCAFCPDKIYAKGLCKNHYQQWRRANKGRKLRKTKTLISHTPDKESDYD
ncbi:MAG: hypothetical protein HQ551_01405 [Desulfobacteraceae bacterium]|nr:hypothetical protein [Desulfobacteraceae bacterium]